MKIEYQAVIPFKGRHVVATFSVAPVFAMHVKGQPLTETGSHQIVIENVTSDQPGLADEVPDDHLTDLWPQNIAQDLGLNVNDDMRSALENLLWPNCPSADDLAVLVTMCAGSGERHQSAMTLVDRLRKAQGTARAIIEQNITIERPGILVESAGPRVGDPNDNYADVIRYCQQLGQLSVAQYGDPPAFFCVKRGSETITTIKCSTQAQQLATLFAASNETLLALCQILDANPDLRDTCDSARGAIAKSMVLQ